MAKYRKRPVEVEAMRFWSEDAGLGVTAWMREHDEESLLRFDLDTDEFYLLIPTLEGEMRVSDGDYVIRGVQGEFYPCKPDIFHATYEEV